MKPNSYKLLTAGFSALLAVSAYAIEAPADNSPAPAAVDATPSATLPKEQAAKPEVNPDTAYLGVVSTEVPEILAEHLNLKPGEGIIVKAVMPDGPAAKAGIAVHDVITRISDQAVGSNHDLVEEVTSHKPGDKLQIQVIHKGKTNTVEATLGNRPAEIANNDMGPQPLDQLNLDCVPKELADRVRNAIQGNLDNLELDIKKGAAEIGPQVEEHLQELKKQLKNQLDAADSPKIEAHQSATQSATIRMMDQNGSIELKSNEGGKIVTLYDKNNKLTWSGPWDTAQDKAAAPEEIRQRVERLNIDSDFRGNGLRLNMGPKGKLNLNGE
ncbi:MAG: PDZ domain-containing protein [Gloeobacteraceae cyanobacterium ES-bin-144]|nr:PDZ domain-containing protein [Verrucomicrobiales bacterium]